MAAYDMQTPIQATKTHRSIPVLVERSAKIRLYDLIEQNPRMPSRTAILGVCDDGLPILFDLEDPAPGAVLVWGNAQSGKTRLMLTMMLSTLAYNSPRDIQLAVIAKDLMPWYEWLVGEPIARYLLGYADAADREASSLILRIGALVESRRTGQQQGPAILLFIDGLDAMVNKDYEVVRTLEWIMEEGPKVRVWPVSAIEASKAGNCPGLVAHCMTLLAGHGSLKLLDAAFGPTGLVEPEKLNPGEQFAVRVGERWMTFDLPNLD